MQRYQIIQSLLDLSEEPTYLEIGVFEGETFNQVRAASKVAVDPHFQFDATDKTGQFYEETSDVFFSHCPGPFDVIFLDGLHTFEQTLRDFCNAACYLSRGGIIVVDDVIPSSFPASLPDLRSAGAVRAALGVEDGCWMGDVYRLVFFIDSFFQQFSFATVAENHGQLIVWQERRDSVTQRTVAELAHLGFEHVVLERGTFNILPLDEIVRRIDEAHAAAGSRRSHSERA